MIGGKEGGGGEGVICLFFFLFPFFSSAKFWKGQRTSIALSGIFFGSGHHIYICLYRVPPKFPYCLEYFFSFFLGVVVSHVVKNVYE